MIVENGEKYACEACIRGHRVSSCTHRDRPLHHINKKGRPVSQCPHCRGLRKSRAQHVKCECGSHSRGHSRNNSTDNLHAGTNHCGCQAGKRCNCALKKEDSDPNDLHKLVTSTAVQQRLGKPGILNRRSESAVPRMRHSSLQQPLPKLNKPAHELAVPYPTPRSSLSGNRPFHHSQRSVDSLPLYSYATSQRVISQPNMHSPQSLPTSTTIPEQRELRTEETSPQVNSSLPNPQLSLDLAEQVPSFDFNSTQNQQFLSTNLSPGNPHRYSINDFSMLNANVSDNLAYSEPAIAVSSGDVKGFGWSEWDFGSAQHNGQTIPQPSIAPSDLSADFSATHRMTHSRSSSVAASETTQATQPAYGSEYMPSALPQLHIPAPHTGWTQSSFQPKSFYHFSSQSVQELPSYYQAYHNEFTFPQLQPSPNQSTLYAESNVSYDDLQHTPSTGDASNWHPMGFNSESEINTGLMTPTTFTDEEVKQWTPNPEPEITYGYSGFDEPNQMQQGQFQQHSQAGEWQPALTIAEIPAASSWYPQSNLH